MEIKRRSMIGEKTTLLTVFKHRATYKLMIKKNKRRQIIIQSKCRYNTYSGATAFKTKGKNTIFKLNRKKKKNYICIQIVM